VRILREGATRLSEFPRFDTSLFRGCAAHRFAVMVSLVQRLFTTFPNSSPGFGLLLLRLSWLAVIVQSSDWSSLGVSVQIAVGVQRAQWMACGLLIVGLFTPYAAAVQACLEGWKAMCGDGPASGHVVLMIVAVSLALLGPGAWSIDARIFGRKRLKLN
jgi:uncharacterized membrane protein YphA (DoxX/SURF4 family)